MVLSGDTKEGSITDGCRYLVTYIGSSVSLRRWILRGCVLTSGISKDLLSQGCVLRDG